MQQWAYAQGLWSHGVHTGPRRMQHIHTLREVRCPATLDAVADCMNRCAASAYYWRGRCKHSSAGAHTMRGWLVLHALGLQRRNKHCLQTLRHSSVCTVWVGMAVVPRPNVHR